MIVTVVKLMALSNLAFCCQQIYGDPIDYLINFGTLARLTAKPLRQAAKYHCLQNFRNE